MITKNRHEIQPKILPTLSLSSFARNVIAQTSGFTRHTLGDFLVVILLFYLVKAFFNFSNKTIGISVLIFAYVVEFLQFVPLLEFLGLQKNRLAAMLLGTTFSMGDLVAYSLGVGTALLLEKN
ncbi:DUF2809 domain-containing protein [Tenacibaculum tangerinum]|uniref:DUF2809 domain-containing protein n=1 Tax=Tenacibaculum tangerinum TaxID=3038772 RepID=A0ABY8L4X0_9FLAO|nr:DUF2809 domain-containing protein [Tenacibaculum tangerinum]WGH75393.1 DUF2809 domain-containing protein [Tenacibaculum tangerinum]